MDIELRTNLPQSLADKQHASRRIEWPVLAYWSISGILGVVFLSDWLTGWHVGRTFSNPWLVAYLVVTLTIGQVIYFIVARHDNRPIRRVPTAIFAVGNGVFETFAFALVYRLGETIGAALGLLVVPAASSMTSLIVGLIFFTIYGGAIHALFWLRILPPHLNDTPLAKTIRRYRLFSEIALVLGWCLCLWLYQDIWTVIFFHMVVDTGLMLRVRPNLFVAAPPPRGPSDPPVLGE